MNEIKIKTSEQTMVMGGNMVNCLKCNVTMQKKQTKKNIPFFIFYLLF